MSTASSRPRWNKATASHLLRRSCFSATTEEISGFAALSPEEAIERVLRTNGEDLPAKPENWDEETFFASVQQMRGENLTPELRSEIRRGIVGMMVSLRRWWLERMLLGRPSIEENLVLFWHGHFATSMQKVKSPPLMLRQNETFRKHALGSIQDLAQAVAEDPAMMLYLDVAGSRPSAPNENFARELFELFLLGEGNYTEADIKESARAFSGYRVDRQTGEVRTMRQQQDKSSKTVFGKSGEWNGRDIIRLAFEQPACARFLAEKLWLHFAGIAPEKSHLERLGQSLRRYEFRTADWLREVFRSKEFYHPNVMGNQIKSPVQWLIGACVELQIPLPRDAFLEGALRQQGQVLFAPPNVRGWEGGRTWINSITLGARYAGAGHLLGIGGRNMRSESYSPFLQSLAPGPAQPTMEQLAGHFFVRPLSPERQESLLADFIITDEALPEKEKLRLAIALLSTPEYQLT